MLHEAVFYAASQNCDCLALPEVAGMLNSDTESLRAQIHDEERDPYINACIKLAKENALWIHNGSTPIISDDGRYLNHSNLIDHAGKVRARYDKIHLFDIALKDRKPIRESDRYAPGSAAVVAGTPWGIWGLSICYDLRFPHLYRSYAKAGAVILFIPSAFTPKTGLADWEVLLRARAIENGCFVVAAAQVGTHDDGRRTYGHSMVIDPWGNVLLDMGGGQAGYEAVTLDLSLVERTQEQIPSLRNGRDFHLEVH